MSLNFVIWILLHAALIFLSWVKQFTTENSSNRVYVAVARSFMYCDCQDLLLTTDGSSKEIHRRPLVSGFAGGVGGWSNVWMVDDRVSHCQAATERKTQNWRKAKNRAGGKASSFAMNGFSPNVQTRLLVVLAVLTLLELRSLWLAVSCIQRQENRQQVSVLLAFLRLGRRQKLVSSRQHRVKVDRSHDVQHGLWPLTFFRFFLCFCSEVGVPPFWKLVLCSHFGLIEILVC